MKFYKIFTLVVFIFFILNFEFVSALTPEELKNAINEKTKNLEGVNDQLKIVNQAYQETVDKSRNLNNELKKIDTNIKQLSLQIKSGEINTEKINLELESLDYKISGTEEKINIKKGAVGNLLRQIHETDTEEPFITMLKNRSLAASVLEIQNLSDLSFDLGADLKILKEYRTELAEYFDETNDKKFELEYENKNLKNRKVIIEGQKVERKSLLMETKNQEETYLAQLDILRKKQAEIAEEIEGVEKELRSRVDPSLLPGIRPGVLMFPVPGGRLTQGYGSTAYALRNYPGRHHNGIDIGKSFGAEIVSSEDGVVVAIGDQDRFCFRGAYGKYIVIEHQNNLTTLYAHLSGFAVIVGQQVKRGDVIGYMGKTGWATGPHLHFTVYSTITYYLKQSRSCGLMPVGGDLDPQNYL